ncbi:hypothetical protein NL676_011222 [Syzygium grande]|nr:hypothetical protein NL676_011222 [Syzygium grande]
MALVQATIVDLGKGSLERVSPSPIWATTSWSEWARAALARAHHCPNRRGRSTMVAQVSASAALTNLGDNEAQAVTLHSVCSVQ